MPTKKLALLGMLIALCVVGRIAFASIPNVQPVTAIIIICSFWMGPVTGLILACGSTIATNMVLGSGTWTVTQIIAWSIIGLMSGMIGKWFQKTPVVILAIYAGACGLLYGFVMSLERLVVGKLFWPYYLAGIPFDVNHAIGNMVFFIVLFPVLSRLLKERATYMLQ